MSRLKMYLFLIGLLAAMIAFFLLTEPEKLHEDPEPIQLPLETEAEPPETKPVAPKIEILEPPKARIVTMPGIAEGKASYYDYSLKDAPDYSKTHLTAAVRDWPRGTELRVCVVDDPGRCVIVRVNDYGPQKALHPDRIIDLSSAAFLKLAPLSKGVIDVTVEIIN